MPVTSGRAQTPDSRLQAQDSILRHLRILARSLDYILPLALSIIPGAGRWFLSAAPHRTGSLPPIVSGLVLRRGRGCGYGVGGTLNHGVLSWRHIATRLLGSSRAKNQKQNQRRRYQCAGEYSHCQVFGEVALAAGIRVLRRLCFWTNDQLVPAMGTTIARFVCWESTYRTIGSLH